MYRNAVALYLGSSISILKFYETWQKYVFHLEHTYGKVLVGIGLKIKKKSVQKTSKK